MLENPRNCKSGQQRCEPASLREWFYCAVHHAPNGSTPQQIADALQWPLHRLIAAVDPARLDRPLPVEAFAPVLRATDQLGPFRFLAMDLKHGIFALPTVGAAQTEINLRLLRVLKELGELSAKLEVIQADGRIDSDEGRQALDELRDLLEAVIALQAAIAEASREAVMARPAAARMSLAAPAEKRWRA